MIVCVLSMPHAWFHIKEMKRKAAEPSSRAPAASATSDADAIAAIREKEVGFALGLHVLTFLCIPSGLTVSLLPHVLTFSRAQAAILQSHTNANLMPDLLSKAADAKSMFSSPTVVLAATQSLRRVFAGTRTMRSRLT